MIQILTIYFAVLVVRELFTEPPEEAYEEMQLVVRLLVAVAAIIILNLISLFV
jgi:hypothetical protein